MSCSYCGRAEGASTPPCPHCPPANDAVVTLVPTEKEHSAQDAAVDPEVLPPEDGQDIQRGLFGARNLFGPDQTPPGGTPPNDGQTHASQSGSFRFAVWHGASSGGTGGGGSAGGMGGMGMGRGSCLPGCITLFLTLVCVVQFGVLAALGFFIFQLMGSGLLLALNLQQIMRGRPPHFGLGLVLGPWLGRIAVWGGSWGLAGWLSGGF